MQCEEGHAGEHMGLCRHTERVPAPGEWQEGRRTEVCRGGATQGQLTDLVGIIRKAWGQIEGIEPAEPRGTQEDTGQLSLQAAGAEGLCGAGGGGGGHTRGTREGQGPGTPLVRCVGFLPPTRGFYART